MGFFFPLRPRPEKTSFRCHTRKKKKITQRWSWQGTPLTSNAALTFCTGAGGNWGGGVKKTKK